MSTDRTYRQLLGLRGFRAFLWTETLGAFNDNAYKLVVSLLAVKLAVDVGAKYLSMAGVVFFVPFLLFSGYAGQIADRCSKRSVLVITKAGEIVAMALGVGAFLNGSIAWMYGVLFLMALQSTFFSPAKEGILPELYPERDLSRVNGMVRMTTFVAIILGTTAGSVLLTAFGARTWVIGLVLVAFAVLGTMTSRGIDRVPASGGRRRVQWNPWAEVGDGVRRLWGDRPLLWTVVGIAYFWFFGALMQLALLLFAGESLGAGDLETGLLLASLAVGIAAGSIAAGRLSGGKIELGLVPLGCLGMGVSSFPVVWAAPNYALVAAALAVLGFWGGLFIVPLSAFLQKRPAAEEKGRALATSNFFTTVGVLAASGVLWFLYDIIGLSAAGIIMAAGAFAVLSTVIAVSLVPEFLARFVIWMLTHTIYRIRIVGSENIPQYGPALLVANHVTFVDGPIIAACIQRFVRFLVSERYYEKFRPLFRLAKAVPVPVGTRKDVITTIRRAREAIEQGHVVCIFAEGYMTRTGNTGRFQRGLEKIVEGLDAPVIPVHLGGLWGSIFSYEGGRYFWKRPRRIPYPVTVSFGKPLPSSVRAHEVRQAVVELGADAAIAETDPNDTLARRFVRRARRHWSRPVVADTTGKRLTYGRLLVGGVLLAGWIRKSCLAQDKVGIMLPASVGAAVANVGVTLAGKVPVNLNFTAGPESIASAIEQCGMRTVITSRTFLAKAKLAGVDGAVFLEDLLPGFGWIEKLRALLAARLLPFHRLVPHTDPVATIIFSSGSTGTPKGVMLSHRNVISNVEAIGDLFLLTRRDCIAGILPLFHSFGYTVTLWLPLIAEPSAAYHPNPTDAKGVGRVVEEQKATVLLATPSFCHTYTRGCTRQQFSSLRYVLAGAEKMRDDVAAAFEEKFCIRPLEGYGATEMSPVISVNTPGGAKQGSVGRPLPGVAVRVVDPDSGERFPPGREGLMLVRGSNRMVGYLGQPGKTAEAIRDGWYVTGDIGSMDEDGFLVITDRQSRFCKIAGEMVPCIRIEECLRDALGDAEACVTSAPDERRGERLVVLHTRPGIGACALWEVLSGSGLPKLWVPRKEDIHFVEALPRLGMGKLDLRGARLLARSLSAAERSLV